jgi:hypothetical protein
MATLPVGAAATFLSIALVTGLVVAARPREAGGISLPTESVP